MEKTLLPSAPLQPHKAHLVVVSRGNAPEIAHPAPEHQSAESAEAKLGQQAVLAAVLALEDLSALVPDGAFGEALLACPLQVAQVDEFPGQEDEDGRDDGGGGS